MGVIRRTPRPVDDEEEGTVITRRPAKDDEPAPRRRRAAPQAEPEPEPTTVTVYTEDELEAMPLRRLKRIAAALDIGPDDLDGAEALDDDNAWIDAILDAQEAVEKATESGLVHDDDDLEDDDEDMVATRSSVVQAGWGAAKKMKNAAAGFATEFRFEEEQQLVKFLSDEPFGSFQQHWIERQGKKSFMCLGAGCPLCRVGDDPSPKTAFNVAVLSDGEAQVQALICGPKLLGQLEALHKDKRNGPLTKDFYAVSRTGKKGSVNYSFPSVKDRDLEEDWEITPEEVADLLKGLQPYDGSVFKPTPKAELVQIAREYAGDED